MENSIKFDHIQNYPGRTGANIMQIMRHYNGTFTIKTFLDSSMKVAKIFNFRPSNSQNVKISQFEMDGMGVIY